MLYIVLPVYWKDAGLESLWQVGILLSVNRFVRLPLNPVIGWLYNKMTLRTGLITAVLMGAITTVGYGLFKGFAIWFILRCLWGVAWSFLRMGGYFTVISYSNDGNRGHLMGSYNGISRLGSLVGMLVGGLLVPFLGLQVVCLLFGIIILLGLPLILFFISHKKVTDAFASPTDKELNAANRLWTIPVIRVLACGLMIALLQAIFSSTLSLIIDTNYSGSVSIFGIILSSTAFAGILQSARWVWEPFLAPKIGRKSDGPRGRGPLFLLSLICAAAGYAMIAWELPVQFWIIIVLFVMMTGTATHTLMDAMASDTAKATSVIAVMTAYSVATDLGSALGPMLTYLFIELENGLLVVYFSSAAAYLGLMLWYRPVFSKKSVEQAERSSSS